MPTDFEKTESKEALEIIKEAGMDDFRKVVAENPGGVKQTIRILANHPDTFKTFSPNCAVLKEARQILFGIDPQSRAEQKEQIRAESAVSPEQLAERERLSAEPAHLDKLNKDHIANIRKWQSTFQLEMNGDEI
ncbi:MAG: hypothetical protein FVQ84_09185 [Planctomycetes bacterium]|nr:hypothetical protein [Planctomycetota bacterium]